MRFSPSKPAWLATLGVAVAMAAAARAGADVAAPRPVAIWPAGPMEVRVAFDQPVPSEIAQALVGKTIQVDGSVARLTFLEAPCPPPFQAQPGPTIAAARREEGGRALVLATDPHPRPAVYQLRLSSNPSAPAERVNYDLSGVEASWDSGGENPKPAWTGWWPDLSPDVTRAATRGSVEHERSLELLTKPGRLTLRTLLGLSQGKVTVRIAASQPIVEAIVGGESIDPKRNGEGLSVVEFPIESTGDPIDLSLTVQTGEGGKPVALRATYQYESRPRVALGRSVLWVPWAPSRPVDPPAAPAPPDFSSGDPKKGEAIFFGDAAKCSNCHQIAGKGGKVGPDLTDVFKRPAAEIYREVTEPSAVIRTEFVPYTVALKDGRVLAGIVRAEGADAIRVTDTEAKATVIPRGEIEDLRPSATSVMPVGLVGAIGEANARDLMAFLMKPKP